MNFRTEIDLTDTPVPKWWPRDYHRLGIRFYHDYENDLIYISRDWWQSAPEIMKEALRWMLVGPPDPIEEVEELISFVKEQLAAEESSDDRTGGTQEPRSESEAANE